MKKLYWVSISALFLFSCVTIKDDSDLVTEFYNVGNSFFELEKYDKALEYYTKVLEKDPDFHKARYNLVYVNVYKEDFQAADVNLNYLSNINEDNLLIKKLSGFVRYKQGRLKDSLREYLEVLDSGDTSEEIRLNVVKIYYQLNEYDKALPYLEDLLNSSDNADFYYIAGLVSFKAGNFKNASSYLEFALDSGKKDKIIVESLVEIYSEFNDYSNLKRVLGLQVDISEKEIKGDIMFQLAKIYLLIDNDFVQGYKFLEDSIKNGFSDIVKSEELLNTPDLIEKEKIRELLINSKILN